MKAVSMVACLTLAVACGRTFSTPSLPPAPSLATPITAVAVQPAVAPTEGSAIQAQGGTPPYTYAFTEHGENSGPDAELDAEGNYRAGSKGSAIDQIRVGDQAGGEAFVSFSVGPPVGLTPASASVAPGGVIDFAATGGKPPYAFSLSSGCVAADRGGASTLTASGSTGLYRATELCGGTFDLISVTDALGVLAGPARVDLGAGLSVLPANAQVAPGQSLTLGASGGLAPYRFRWARHGNLSAGTLTEGGLYRAGANPEVVDQLEAVDAAGAVVAIGISVGDLEYDLPPQGSYELHSANLNADGFADLFAVSTSGVNIIEVFLGSPAGLISTQIVTASGEILGITIGDLDGDGLDDLLFEVQDVDVERYEILHTQPDGTLTYVTRFDAYTPGVVGWSLSGLPVVVEGPNGNLLAFHADYTSVTSTNSSELLLLAFPPSGTGTFPTDLGPLPLIQEGSVPLPYPACPYGVELSGVGTGLVMFNQSSTSSDECELDPGPFPLTWIPSFDPVPDGGLAPHEYATTQVPLCPTCANFDQRGRIVLGEGDFAAKTPSLYVAQSSPYATGLLTLAPMSSAGSLSAPTTLDVPPAAWVQTVSAVVFDAGAELPARVDVVGSGPGEEVEVEGGTLTPTQTLPSDLISSSAASFTGGLLPDLTTMDLGGHLRLLPSSLQGQYGSGNRVAFLGQDTAVIATDLDGDGLSDLVLAARSVEVLSGTPGGFSSDAEVLSGANVVALVPGQPEEVWGLIGTPVAPSLVRFHGGADGGPSFDLIALDPSTPQGALSTASTADGGLGLVLDVADDAGAHWVAFALDANRSPIPVASGSWPGAEGAVAAPPSAGGTADILVTTTDVVIRLGSDGDGGYASVASLRPTSLTGSCDDYYFTGSSILYPLRVGGVANQVAGLTSGASFDISCDVFSFLFTGSLSGRPVVDSAHFLAAAVNLVPIDLDGDGNTDLIVNGVNVDTGASATIAWGDGHGGFTLLPIPYSDQALSQFDRLTPGDFDGDGHLDLAFVLPTGEITVLFGDGQRNFR